MLLIEKSTRFLSKFCSKFHHDYDESRVPYFANRTDVAIDEIYVSAVIVKKLLLNLDTSKQGGEDGLSNRMLKMVAASLDVPLSRLFNLFLSSGHFPAGWKLGIVIPIFKNKGSKCSPDNYRPVTLLNSLSKIFERTVYDVILHHLQQNDLLFERQSGFLPGHDTQKQLVDIVHYILSNNESRKVTRGVFLDISGAFDAVPHYLLLKKLKCHGIQGNVLNLLQTYLQGRSIKTRVNNSLSEVSTDGLINCGVPQGSILGPLLFLIYINDLSDVIHNCHLYIYADDCSLFLPTTVSNHLLQGDLERLSIWANDWKLNFKAEKSKEVIFHSARRVVPNFDPLFLANNIIPRGNSHKHLGLILDEKLTFQEHLTGVIVKCNSLLNPLKALKQTVQSKHLERLYFSFILPHLEYGSIIFDSANASILAKLEQIHYRAALIVSGCIWGSNRTKVFKCLDWMTLEQRRVEKKLVLMYDIENRHITTYVLDNFVQYRNPIFDVRLRNHQPYRLPVNVSLRFAKSTVPSSIKLWLYQKLIQI
jgi:hypothetical protein